MSDNLVLDFIEKEGYKDKITDADNKLIEANIELSNEIKWLKKDKETLTKTINKIKNYLDRYFELDESTGVVNQLYEFSGLEGRELFKMIKDVNK